MHQKKTTKKNHIVHSRKSPQETRTPTLSKILGSMMEGKKEKKNVFHWHLFLLITTQ